ncbi:MAG: energy-coupling factor ABC transporter ATP-binding protein [Nitrososphaeria archaeon]
MATLIQFVDFSFSYLGSSNPTLKNINLSIGEGEFVLLVGPSGCGKSTLLRCINGLIPHLYNGVYQGKVIVDNKVVSETNVSELATKVGFVFQNPENQIFMFSVEKDIVFGLENIGVEREEMCSRLEWALKILDIEHLRHKAPYELSDGQKQRVAIAGTLVMRPKILILDEPTSLLDPKTAYDFILTLKTLNKELNITVIVVEHRIDLLTNVADRIIVMNNGEILCDGRLRDVIKQRDLHLYGVAVPPIISLQNSLSESGIGLSHFCLNVKEFAESLRRGEYKI